VKPAKLSSESEGGMNDEDVKCYEKRYSDLQGMGAREHFQGIGHYEGRNPTCGRNLTTYESESYLNRNPDLQHEYGRRGAYALSKAR